MLLPDFQIQFGDIGEIIFTALQQILDVAPKYEGTLIVCFIFHFVHE